MVAAQATPCCGKKRSSLSREDDGPALPVTKRMQSALVITGLDGQVRTRDGHGEASEPWSLCSKFDPGSVNQALLTKSRMAPIQSPCLPAVNEPGFWTPQPQLKIRLFPTPYKTSKHTLSRVGLSKTPLGSDYTGTPKGHSTKARLRMSGRKLKSKAVAKLQVLDDQELQASRLVQVRQDIRMERLERAYMEWLNHVLDKPPAGGSQLSNFEDFVSRNSSISPAISAYGDIKRIDDVQRVEDCLISSPYNPIPFGRSPRNALLPLNGVGNRGFGSPLVGNVNNSTKPLKDPFATPDKAFTGQLPATQHLSSKRLKMITEHGLSYPRDTHMQDVCRLSDLARRLKLHFNQAEREEILGTITQLAKHIDEGRLRMKKGCAILADVALRKKALHVLLNYNAYWLRIGLHVVLGHTALLKERLNEDDCKRNGDKRAQDAEFALLEVFLERHFLAHPGLAKNYATNKAIEGLYRDGYSEALGRVILKRFFLLVLVLDKAKCQTSLKISDGIDGVDGGSPPLFRSDARVKSSRRALQEFLSEVMHGEGDVIGNLNALGYLVHHHQVPLADYDFAIVDLIGDLQDGVRLCRLVQLLAANDSFFLEHIQVPSNGRKRRLHNCQIALESLAHAGVPLEDEDGCSINAEDIVGGNREKVFPLLWNIMVHLQIPLLVNRPRLCQELATLQGTESDLALGLNIGTVELLLKWTQVTCMISGNLNVRNFKTSFADGQAFCLIINLYLPFLLPHNALLRPAACSSIVEEDICAQNLDVPDGKGTVISAYEKVVAHNFSLVQTATRQLGNIPEVLQLVDLLGDPGISERNIIIFVAFLCSRLLTDKPLDLRTIRQRRASIALDGHSDPVDELLKYSSQCSIESESPSGFNRSYTVPWPQHEALCGTVQPLVMVGQTPISEVYRGIRGDDSVEKICKIQAWWRSLGDRKQFLSRRRAARKIQGVWRKISARLRLVSAMKIQAHWRGYLLRKLLKSLDAAASVIQSHYRCHIKRKLKREQAVHVLQYYFRVWAQRKRYLATVSSMCKIQALWWAQEARVNFLRERRAVRKIQIEWLHYVARRTFRTAQAQWQKSRGAEILQAHWRGYSTRQMLIKQSKAATKIQSHCRGYIQRKKYNHQRLTERSTEISVRAWILNVQVTRVQAYWRGHRVRALIQRRAAQVTRIQACWRGHTARQNSELKKRTEKSEHTAIPVIQTFVQGQIQRKDYRRQRLAAHIIQVHVRQWIQNRSVQATRIQACWRGYSARRQFEVKKHAATVQSTAALLIQSFVRGHIQRKDYRRRTLAVESIQVQVRAWIQNRSLQATRIQACWRRHIARRRSEVKKHAAKIQSTAALLIQSFVRGYIQRKDYRRRTLAVQCIQVQVRAWIQNRSAQATRIQACWRGHIARRHFEVKKDAEKIQLTAALLIQRLVRGHIQRKDCRRRTQAVERIQVQVRSWVQNRSGQATKIQAWWRGCWARQQFELQERTIKMQSVAASLIQSFVRGHIQRKDYRRRRLAVLHIQVHVRAWIQTRNIQANRIQTCWRGHKARQQFGVEKKAAKIQSRAASLIQRFFRGHTQRKEFQHRRVAVRSIQVHVRAWIRNRSAQATKIQACWRGHSARQLFQVQKQNAKIQSKAAALMQSCFRGHTQRKSYQRQKLAVQIIQVKVRAWIRDRGVQVTRIQACWRAYQARQQFEVYKRAAKKIQREWRLFIVARNARHFSAIEVIQAKWKGILARKAYLKFKSSVVAIQAYYRSHLARADYRRQKLAAIVIQARCRAFVYRRRFQAAVNSAYQIQSRWRAYESRRTFLIRRIAASTLQRYWRKFSYRRRNLSAVKIQARWRGCRLKKSFVVQMAAASLIQRHWRDHLLYRRRHQAAIKSASVIQSRWRAHACHRRFLVQKTAAIKLQQQWRKFSQLSSNAARIQAIWRGYRVRKDLHGKISAASLIQRHYRVYLQRTAFLRYKKAALVIQAYYRHFTKRCRITMLNTCKVQAIWRAHSARRRFLEQRQAAQQIQRAWWLYWTRRRYQSAVRIQASWRCYSSKRMFLRFKSATTLIQTCYKCFIQRREYLKHRHAALFIQIQVKAWIHRCLLRATTVKITKLQAMWRGHWARTQYLNTMIAVEKIQRTWRRYAARRRHDAVLQLQTTWRGYLARRMVRCWTAATILIQKHYRGFLKRKEYKRYVSAVLTCQAGVRGFLVRKTIKGCKEGFTQNHAVVRGMLQSLRLSKEVKSSSRIRSGRQEDQTLLLRLRSARTIQVAWRKHLELVAATKIQDFYSRRGNLQHMALLHQDSESQACSEVPCDPRHEQFASNVGCPVDPELQIHNEMVLSANSLQAEAPHVTVRWKPTAVTIQPYFSRCHAHDRLNPQWLSDRAADIDTQVCRKEEADTWNSAAKRIQACWRGHCLKEKIILHAKKTVSCNVDNIYVNILDQRLVASQTYSSLKLKAGHLILNWLKAVVQRLYFLRLRRCTVVIQKRVRGWMSRIAMCRKKRCVTLVQAHWRGFLVRKGQSRLKDPLGELRQRMQSTAATVQDSERLCNRLTEALALLLSQRTVSGILNICRTIDVATRHSLNSCERLAEAGAIPKILNLIRTMNRSPPHEQVLKHALSILNNLAHHPGLATLIAEAPAAISIISEQLHMFRNKDEIFAQAISVLQLVCKTSAGVEVLRRERPVFRRFQLIAQSLDRKRNAEKLPSATAQQKRLTATHKINDANCQFLSLLNEINRLAQCQTTVATPKRTRHFRGGTPVQSLLRVRSVAPATIHAKQAGASYYHRLPFERLSCGVPPDVSFPEASGLF